MTAEDGDKKVSPDDSQARHQRKKRKWDQPAECLVAAGLRFPDIPGNSVPVVGPDAVPIFPSLLATSSGAAPHMLPLSGVMAPAAAVIPKLNQPKAQEELVIAREIIINDADPVVRYKLTKRQTQEEIQKSTGAVVTTRGKYRPPNAPSDGEKPLYLHISAGSHLKETVERIIAVDRAAAMIEEKLKQGSSSQNGGSYLVMGDGVKASQALSACVYLGFDINPSWNIISRIRGPNDQYINHIINETGVSISLRGRGSGTQGLDGEEGQHPLHLFLSCSNPKSLENAKNLAEHLLDTISVEFGVSRASAAKVYAAVPPPQPLVAGPLIVGNDFTASIAPPVGMPPVALAPPPVSLPLSTLEVNSTPILGPVSLSGVMSNGAQYSPNILPPSLHLVTGGTKYSGYEGIYPQATPLQQVALVLRHSTNASTSSITNTVASSTSTLSTTQPRDDNGGPEKDKRHAHRRKFQELPVLAKEPPASNQESRILKLGEPEAERDAGRISGILPPKKWGPVFHEALPTLPSPKGMSPPPPPKCMPPPPPKSMPPPPPPRSMPSVPPPPKFGATSKPTNEGIAKNSSPENNISEPIPDTLVKLMEYGEEDDDDFDEGSEEKVVHNSNVAMTTPKPFWAL